jgi:hypothetical protein
MAAQANEFATIDFAAFSGADTVSPYESENGAGSTSAATLQPGTVTPNEANALIISGASGALSATFSINLGFTITDQNTGSPSSFASAMAYLIQTNAVAVNPTWTESPSGKLAVNIAVFKAAASSTGLLLERRRKALLAL